MDEVKRIIVSRSKLKEHGYDGDNISDKDLETIGDEIFRSSDLDEHFSDILEYVMIQIMGMSKIKQDFHD